MYFYGLLFGYTNLFEYIILLLVHVVCVEWTCECIVCVYFEIHKFQAIWSRGQVIGMCKVEMPKCQKILFCIDLKSNNGSSYRKKWWLFYRFFMDHVYICFSINTTHNIEIPTNSPFIWIYCNLITYVMLAFFRRFFSLFRFYT